jgi:protein tyrosine/serine phosphatase
VTVARRRGLVVAIALLAVAGGAYAWWSDQGRHLFFPKNWGVVEEGRIYRSGQIHSRLVEDVLAANRVRVVVDLAADDAENPHADAEREAVARLGIRKVDVTSLDGSGLGDPERYVEALGAVVRARDAGEPVLVHCAGGSERTGVVVGVYRMLVQGWDGARAWDEYVSYRKDPPQREDLRRYVNEHLPRFAEALRTLGVPVDESRLGTVFGPATGR